MRLPPSSRLRHAILERATAGSTAALNRGDVEASLIHHEPDVRLNFIGWTGIVGDHYYGSEGFREVITEWFENLHAHWTVEEIVDEGDRVAVRYRMTANARGAQTEKTVGYVLWLSPRGRTRVQDAYWHWDDALQAARSRAPSDPSTRMT